MVESAQAADSFDEATEHIRDDFIDLIAIAGTPAEANEKLEKFRQTGVTHPIILPATLGSSRYDTVEQTMTTFSPR
jgi:alkanesulfonate monooxygenase SsuD/methylene tetrahydromethanopterin reductase-like flavin-dependent oxidoreductase (luciferase family)